MLGNAEFLEQQWRLLDLVPRRLPVFMLFLLAGIAVLAGLEAAYSWMLDRVADGRYGHRGARSRRERQPCLLVLLAHAAGSIGRPRCWSTMCGDTGLTTTKGDTASGAGPPFGGSSWRPIRRPASAKGFEI